MKGFLIMEVFNRETASKDWSKTATLLFFSNQMIFYFKLIKMDEKYYANLQNNIKIKNI